MLSDCGAGGNHGDVVVAVSEQPLSENTPADLRISSICVFRLRKNPEAASPSGLSVNNL